MIISVSKPVPVRSHLRFHRYRDVHVRNQSDLYSRESRTCDSHNGQQSTVDGELFIQDIRIAAEMPRPVSIAEYRHTIRASRSFVLCTKNSPEKGPHAQHLEIIAANKHAFGEL